MKHDLEKRNSHSCYRLNVLVANQRSLQVLACSIRELWGMNRKDMLKLSLKEFSNYSDEQIEAILRLYIK